MFKNFSLAPDSPWFLFLISSVALLIPLLILRSLVARGVRRVSNRAFPHFSKLLVSLVRETNILLLLMVSAYIVVGWYDLPKKFEQVLFQAVFVAIVIQFGVWISLFAEEWFAYHAQRKHAKDPSSLTAFGLLSFAARMLIWIVVALIVLENLGFNISTLVAGLGIGGVAVALAVQKLLGDLLSSLSIILDKPFVVGDAVTVGDTTGTIERIGVKTTHIRALSGEQVILNNSDLLGSRIRNFKRQHERRVMFTIGIVYETAIERVEEVPALIREIIQSQASTRFDRAHLRNFGDWALVYEVVYYVTSPDYTLFMDTQQQVNFAIIRKFQQLGIEFAYPTQTSIVKDSQPAATT